jgi:hypothetical protein
MVINLSLSQGNRIPLIMSKNMVGQRSGSDVPTIRLNGGHATLAIPTFLDVNQSMRFPVSVIW